MSTLHFLLGNANHRRTASNNSLEFTSPFAPKLKVNVISYGRSRGRSVLDKADIRAENLGTAARPDGTGQALRLGRAE